MLSALVIICLLTLVDGLRSRISRNPLAEDFPFYHSTDQIHATVISLSRNCHAPFAFHTVNCGINCNIDVVDIGNQNNQHKVFYLFGEHARELISPETAVQLMQDLCSENPSNQTIAALNTSQFRIIPNGNPASRREVEKGAFCLRANPNGVDLNRNWDVHWTQESPSNTFQDQVNPGSSPFSESETKAFRDSVSGFHPAVFAAIHSGTLGMYMPWAVSEEHSKVRNEIKMNQVLSQLDARYCKCPSGPAAQQVGYDSPGTCLDWVHSNTKAAFSFAFEIFTGYGVDELRDRYKMQSNNMLRSSFIDIEETLLNRSCFTQFNPETKSDFDRTIHNWSKALVELAIVTSTSE
jgi:hypothetical protein